MTGDRWAMLAIEVAGSLAIVGIMYVAGRLADFLRKPVDLDAD